MNEFILAYLNMWQNFALFTGRSGRGDYWRVFAVNLAIGFVLGVLSQLLDVFSWIGSLYSLAALIPGLALAVRRLHDVGKSGLYVLYALIPLVGWIIVLIPLAQAGDPAENRFGPVPA
ncbi:MAG TPA: DUF805 domain-containing protein [Oscillospiraceae bacterium]|nr:DUF805 domain-containing protein [Oscillospiraceae bacterium]HNW03837.1 DUF805 domain-containing protein [Oscillospiraceae bacterium]HPW00277.1 DUF805 domain-containing protein [Oscillospiraceae bacterium]